MAVRKIPVASVQTIAHDVRHFEEHWPRIAAAIEDAAARGAKLVVAPEGTVPGYVIGTEPIDSTLVMRAAAHIGDIARRYGATIVYGTAWVDGDQTFNAAVVVGPAGDILGHAEKQFLWHFDGRWFARGRTLEPIETPLGKLGILICADGRIPTLARTLVERGAEILIIPTAWVTSGRNPEVLENVQADFMAAVRARENGVPLIAANKAGVEANAVAYCGKSAIIDASGDYVARAAERNAQTLFGEVSVGGEIPRAAGGMLFIDGVLPNVTQRSGRFGVTPAADANELAALERMAAFSDVDVMITAESVGPRAGEVQRIGCGLASNTALAADGVTLACVSNSTMLDPGALVRARLRGIDLFVWTLDAPLDSAWQVAFARTRAAELRAYVIVIDRCTTDRAFAVDPDGVVVCGTFEAFRLAQFSYDRARTAATFVAPRTDVLAGLRAVEILRSSLAVVR